MLGCRAARRRIAHFVSDITEQLDQARKSPELWPFERRIDPVTKQAAMALSPRHRARLAAMQAALTAAELLAMEIDADVPERLAALRRSIEDAGAEVATQ